MRNLRYAIRQLLGSPGYTVVAILTLTLGMGATAAFFSVLYGVVFRPLPFPDAERLVSLVNTRPETDDDGERLSRAEIADIQARQRAFTAIGATNLGRMTLNASEDGAGFAERVKVADVTPEVFTLLGVPAARGRTFTAADVGAGRLAVISDAVWRARYAAAPDAVGRTIGLNGERYAIVGVMPPGFAYPEGEMAVWLPFDLRPPDAADRNNRELFTVARLAEGVSLAQAREDLARVAAELRAAQPADYPTGTWTLGATSLRDRQFGHMRLPLVVLFLAAASVLLIACVNVAIMALLRAVARRREIAIRLALGASRGAIVRQLLAEAAILAACGAIGGALVARLAVEALVAGAPPNVPRLDQIALDLPALLFTAGALVVVTLVVGLAPSLVPAALRGTDGVIATHRASDSRATARLRDGLTIAEVALAAALVICAGLTLRSLQGLLQVDVGFATADRVSFKTNLTARSYPDAARVDGFYRQLLERLAAVPGVARVGAVSYAPMSNEGQVAVVAPEAPVGSPPPTPVVRWSVVRGRYFEAMGIAVRRGRVFDEATDRATAPLTAVVDDTLARRWWGREEAAIGQRVRVGEGPDVTIREIVGVVGHVAHGGPADVTMPMIYVPQAQVYQRGMYTVVESRLPAEQVLAAARQALAAIDPAVPLYFAETQAARYDSRVALPRFVAGLVGAFSTLALALAGVGIFGVTAYAVRQRTREFGIRLAIGAPRANIGGLVLRRVAVLTGAGLVCGGALAAGLGTLMRNVLYQVEPDDPPAFAMAAAAMAATALLACLAPIRAAIRVDPAVTLKTE